MKELVFDEMEAVRGGFNLWACIGNTASGMGVLSSVAFVATFTTNPIGLGLLALSAISLFAGSVADPDACD
jgi:hypothetical protein